MEANRLNIHSSWGEETWKAVVWKGRWGDSGQPRSSQAATREGNMKGQTYFGTQTLSHGVTETRGDSWSLGSTVSKHLEYHFDFAKLTLGHRTLGNLEKGKEKGYGGEDDSGNLIRGRLKELNVGS